MAHGAVQPGKRGSRYEQVSGGLGQRRIYYLARRKLQLSPEEWDALPWWQERMYVEGFGEEEFVELDGTEFEPAQEAVDEPVSYEGPDPIDKALAGAIRRRQPKPN